MIIFTYLYISLQSTGTSTNDNETPDEPDVSYTQLLDVTDVRDNDSTCSRSRHDYTTSLWRDVQTKDEVRPHRWLLEAFICFSPTAKAARIAHAKFKLYTTVS